MSYLLPTDFTGKYAITQSFNADGKLQMYIDTYQSKYMNDLLGAELYVLFQANDEDPIYIKLYDAFSFDSEDGKPYVSEGIEDMLKCFTYAHYQMEDLGIATSFGQVKPNVEAGTLNNNNYQNAIAYFNQGVKTYKAIQQYIKENRADYPEFKGVSRRLTWFI